MWQDFRLQTTSTWTCVTLAASQLQFVIIIILEIYAKKYMLILLMFCCWEPKYLELFAVSKYNLFFFDVILHF